MYDIQNAKQLSNYLKALRQSRHLTQADLGSMLGVSAARVGKIERHPGAVTMDKLLEVFRLLGARLEVVDRGAELDAPVDRQPASTKQDVPDESKSDRKETVRKAGEW